MSRRPAEHPPAGRAAAQQHPLGHLEGDAAARQLVLVEQLGQQDRQLLVGELADADVHRDADVRVDRPHPGQLGQRLAQRVAAEVGDQPGLLGDVHERRRRDGAAPRTAPAQQRLVASGPLIGQVDDRLVDHRQLVLVDAAAKLRTEHDRVGSGVRLAHLDRSRRRAAGPAPSRAAGRAQQLVGQHRRRGRLVPNRPPRRRWPRPTRPGPRRRTARGRRRPARPPPRSPRPRCVEVLDQHRELDAPDVRHRRRRARHLDQPLRRQPQHLVAGRRAERLVQLGQSVDGELDDGEVAVGSRPAAAGRCAAVRAARPDSAAR